MRSVRPAITGEEEYQGYQRGRDTLTEVVQERERPLIEALASGDEARSSRPVALSFYTS